MSKGLLARRSLPTSARSGQAFTDAETARPRTSRRAASLVAVRRDAAIERVARSEIGVLLKASAIAVYRLRARVF
jgi:hypothetical protein